MLTREEMIKSLPFFMEKQQLAEQIILLEQRTGNYLPNEFQIKRIPPYEIGERMVVIGRIYDYYFLGITRHDTDWKYQAFENEGKCKEFFIHLPNMEQADLAFWLNNIEMLK